MLDALPKDLQHRLIDGMTSPRTRNAVAQVNHTLEKATQDTDAPYYQAWLQSDFDTDGPARQEDSKAQYRGRLDTSQQEKDRLLGIARLGQVSGLTAGMQCSSSRQKLSNRYGKLPVAKAGLEAVQNFASPVAPSASPPRLRAGELTALVEATHALHTVGQPSAAEQRQFGDQLDAAARAAAGTVTLATSRSTVVPGAPQRNRRGQFQPCEQRDRQVQRVLQFE